MGLGKRGVNDLTVNAQPTAAQTGIFEQDLRGKLRQTAGGMRFGQVLCIACYIFDF